MERKPKMEEVVTPALKSCVGTYLLARAAAEVLREKVDKVYREILTERPVYADKLENSRQIFKGDDLYLVSDDVVCQQIYAEADRRLRALKIKPDEMPSDYCPALVAEELQRKSEFALIEEAGQPFGITYDRLMSSKNPMKNRQDFIDLTTRLVVSLPDFKNPLTGKG
jgi:hypothetical protein